VPLLLLLALRRELDDSTTTTLSICPARPGPHETTLLSPAHFRLR
jgi:hypothetical protein